MSVNVQLRGAKFQLRVEHRLLPKAFFATFPDEMEARSYGDRLQALLDRDVVPQELLADAPRGPDDPLLFNVIGDYIKEAPVTASDRALLGLMTSELVGVRVGGVSVLWASGYVTRLKIKSHLAPSSIRKRVGVLGRVLDWHLRKILAAGVHPPSNALRLLPSGYSGYTEADAAELAKRGLDIKRDMVRDRRLGPGEEARILDALTGKKRADRERALKPDAAFTMFYHLIVDTGLRLREAYRLRVGQIDLARRVINVEGSKGTRDEIKPRIVSIKPELLERLQAYFAGREGLMFGFWNGLTDAVSLRRTTGKLSVRFRDLFSYAQVEDFTEHDLRHEATCRWILLRKPSTGHWIYSEIQICKLMGWTDPKMMLRYASLRAEDMSDSLYDD